MNRRPLVALIAAQVFSISGTRLATVALPWFVLVSTGDALLTGAVALVEMLPYVLVKALAGPLIDRLGAKKVAVCCDLASVPPLLAIPVAQELALLSVPALMAMVALVGGLRGPSDAAKYALVPQLADLADVALERATGIAGTVERLGSTAGAALAGLIVAAIGPTSALALTAGGFLVGATIIAAGVPRQVIPVAQRPAGDARPGASYLTDLRIGWRFLRMDPVLVGITLVVALANLLDQSYVAVLVPVWAQQTGAGSQGVGFVLAVFAGGAMVGATAAATVADRLPRLPVFVVAYLLTGLPRFLVLGLDAPLPVLASVLCVSGFACGFLNPILGAVIFERIPVELRGRVSALNTALCWSLIPLGGPIGGLAVVALGWSPAFLLFGIGYLMVTLLPLARPSFRAFSERPAPAMPAAAGAA